MNGRLGVRIGGAFAIAACAILVACGGGGGGGVTPASQTPTPAPTGPAPQSTTAALSSQSTTAVNFGAVSSNGANVITGADLTLPLTSVDTKGTVSVSASALNNAPAPSARIVHLNAQALGVPTTPIVYFGLSVADSATIYAAPAVKLTGVTITQQCYLVVYDPTNPSAGWNGIAGPATPSHGTVNLSAISLMQPFTLKAGQTYIFAVVTSQSVVPTPSTAPTATATGTGSPLPAVTTAPQNAGWTPYQVAHALQFPVMSGYGGAGQTIAIVGDANPSLNDIQTFLSAFQISRRGSFSIVNIDGGPDGSGAIAGDDGEATLDVEVALSLAPDANVLFYAIPNTDNSSFLAAESYVLTDPNKPSVLSESFGGCEAQSNLQDDQLFSQGAANRISYTASSGDEGNECFTGTDGAGNPTYTPGPNNPASDPYVMGVGGNENANGSRTGLGSLTSQTVWNDSYLSGPGASGGGVSTLFKLPSYQNGLAGIANSTWRNVPDISMPAEGVAIFFQGSWQQFGGTSWGAPEAAALIAEINQYCGGTGAPANTVAPLYTAFAANAASFLDITANNNQFGNSNPFYRSQVGYDNTSGLGIPYGTKVAQQLCPSHAWTVRSAAMARSVARESYGVARDTELANAVNLARVRDLGQRSADSQSNVSLVLRNTSTVAQDEQSVIAVLQTAGFHIVHTYGSHLLIEASAPASTINSYFRTSLHDVGQGRYGTRYANATSMTLPAVIAPYVKGVVADNLITRHRMSYRIR